MEAQSQGGNSTQWNFFVKTSFAIAMAATALGVYNLPGPLLVKGYFMISSLFLVFSAITLSKTVRDDHEASRLHNQINEARTNRMIRELDVD
ncbi:MAG: YiaA/YiaB family inner membrane protein [Halioglobus sp.]|nr:YiaA/YiaB family inner membrane protein [Halioglobus sp.]